MFVGLKKSGNIRNIAESAWVSTLDEAKAKEKSDAEVIRVVTFLKENNHTTPFESVTLTLALSSDNLDSLSASADFKVMPVGHLKDFMRIRQEDIIQTLMNNKFTKSSYENNIFYATLDLFNFLKIVKKLDPIWMTMFKELEPDLVSIVEDWNLDQKPIYTPSNIDYSVLGETNITVELVNVHDIGIDSHRRYTWRVCGPLSILVQMLRHRTASFNMTSGRYRTLNQDLVDIYSDILELSKKMSFDIDSYMAKGQESMNEYLAFMKVAKNSKAKNLISNSEYKRLREYGRYILPEGRMTELYVTFYNDDFVHYLSLRETEHAQIEHAYIAKLMHDTAQASKP